MEFYAHEPWGFPVLDMWHGMQCATMLAPYMKKGHSPDPRDFMVRRPPERELTPEETVAYFKAALGG